MKSLLKKKNAHLEPMQFTPENTVSAFIELPDGVETMETIWHTSSIALDTEQICFIYTLADDGLYFLAAPASSFLGKENSATPLAAALPGNEAHKGDGAYICSVGSNLFAVVIKGPKSLSSFIGDRTSVIQFSGEHQQFWVEKSSTKWFSLTQYKQASTIKLMNIISTVCLSSMLVLLLMSAGFKHQTANLVADMKDKQAKVALLEQQNLLMMNMNNQNNPVNKLLQKYLDLSSNIIKFNGRLTNYEYKANHLHYTIELPSSTTNLSVFGNDVVPVVKEDIITIEKEENL